MFVVIQKLSVEDEGEYQHFIQSFTNKKDAEVYVSFLKKHQLLYNNDYEIIEKEPLTFEPTFKMEKRNIFQLDFHMGYKNRHRWIGSTKPKAIVINNVDYPEYFVEDWNGQNHYNEMDYYDRCDQEQFYIELKLEIACERIGFKIDNNNSTEVANIFVEMVEDKRKKGYDQKTMREWINSDKFIEEFQKNWKIRE